MFGFILGPPIDGNAPTWISFFSREPAVISVLVPIGISSYLYWSV